MYVDLTMRMEAGRRSHSTAVHGVALPSIPALVEAVVRGRHLKHQDDVGQHADEDVVRQLLLAGGAGWVR